MHDERPSDVLGALVEGAHLAVPDDVVGMLAGHGLSIGISDVGLYLVDLEQRSLRPVPNPTGPAREPVDIDATLAGRCFRYVEIQWTDTPDAHQRGWVPIVDGTERIGVLEVVVAAGSSRPTNVQLDAFAGLVAELITTKTSYGDLFKKVRRTRPLSQSAELLWQLLPPLTLASRELVITAMLAPPYDLGGDVFDYAVSAKDAHLAIFDAMGHGLGSGLLATVALAAYRNTRRSDGSLSDSVLAIDRAIADIYEDSSFVTGVISELDPATGHLHYCVAGHPAPLLLRNGQVVKELGHGTAGPPLGLRMGPWTVNEEALEPRDRVIFFTDGVTEARDEHGEFLGEARLVDFIVEASGTGSPPPETLRRLLQSILRYQGGDLQDDATVVMLEWHGPGPKQMMITSQSNI